MTTGPYMFKQSVFKIFLLMVVMFSAVQESFAFDTTKIVLNNANYTCQDQKLYFNLIHEKGVPNFYALVTSAINTEVDPQLHSTPVDVSSSFVAIFHDPSIGDATLITSADKKVITSELIPACSCETGSNGSACAKTLQVIGNVTVTGIGTKIDPIEVTYLK